MSWAGHAIFSRCRGMYHRDIVSPHTPPPFPALLSGFELRLGPNLKPLKKLAHPQRPLSPAFSLSLAQGVSEMTSHGAFVVAPGKSIQTLFERDRKSASK